MSQEHQPDSHDDSCSHGHDDEANHLETSSLVLSGGLVCAALLTHSMVFGSKNLTAGLALGEMVAGGWFLVPKA